MKSLNFVSSRVFAPLIVLVSIVSTAVYAHQGATGVIKARMDMMKEVALSMKQLGQIVKGQEDFNKVQVQQAADIISSHAVKLVELFPEGSSQKPSEAALAIWERRTEFDAIFDEMKVSAERISQSAEIATKGDELDVDFKILAETCSACHKLYRIKK